MKKVNLSVPMMLSFLIDQIQLKCCRVFQSALGAQKRISYLWEKLRRWFEDWLLSSWEEFYAALINGVRPTKIIINTS